MGNMYDQLAAKLASHIEPHLDLEDMDSDTLGAGQAVAGDGSGGLTTGLVLKEYVSQAILFSDLGSGASDDIALTGFPTNVIVYGAAVEIDTPFAGEADLAIAVGDADVDGLLVATTINGVAAGWMNALPGAESGGHPETAYAPSVRFTATALDDVSAGACKVHIFYAIPNLTA